MKKTPFTEDTKKMINEDAVYNPYRIFLRRLKKRYIQFYIGKLSKNHKSLLERLDIMTMSTGIEARVPF